MQRLVYYVCYTFPVLLLQTLSNSLAESYVNTDLLHIAGKGGIR